MKKIYMIPTLQVVKIQPAQFIAMSYGGTTEATSGNLGRQARISDWDEDWDEE
jgi:hypothetical protein